MANFGRPELGDLRAATSAAGAAASRKYSAICVLSVRRRMLCSSRWVIPGLAAGVTGWPVDQRVPTAAGLRAASRRACRCDSAGSGVQARRLAGLLWPVGSDRGALPGLLLVGFP